MEPCCPGGVVKENRRHGRALAEVIRMRGHRRGRRRSRRGWRDRRVCSRLTVFDKQTTVVRKQNDTAAGRQPSAQIVSTQTLASEEAFGRSFEPTHRARSVTPPCSPFATEPEPAPHLLPSHDGVHKVRVADVLVLDNVGEHFQQQRHVRLVRLRSVQVPAAKPSQVSQRQKQRTARAHRGWTHD